MTTNIADQHGPIAARLKAIEAETRDGLSAALSAQASTAPNSSDMAAPEHALTVDELRALHVAAP